MIIAKQPHARSEFGDRKSSKRSKRKHVFRASNLCAQQARGEDLFEDFRQLRRVGAHVSVAERQRARQHVRVLLACNAITARGNINKALPSDRELCSSNAPAMKMA